MRLIIAGPWIRVSQAKHLEYKIKEALILRVLEVQSQHLKVRDSLNFVF